jgi:diguanylate cyclase (GGDEF)-like protein
MDIIVDHRQISEDERTQIKRQVQSELVDHLYRGCLPGTISGMVASIAIFLDYYGYSPTYLLVSWMIVFNTMMLTLTALYFIYAKFKDKLQIIVWEKSYSVVMSGCAMSWVPAVLLMPNDITHQFLALLALFLATAGYATGTIGQFRLCVFTLNIMLLPLIIFCLIQGGIFYNIIATFSTIYMAFMFGINHRSTKWFKDSLKLKLENTLVSYQANHDLLTDLPNQRLLPQYIESAIANVKNTEKTFALLCFSLNRMEMINDSLGHKAGDAIIQSVASRLNMLAMQAAKNPSATQYMITISRKDTFNILFIPIRTEQVEDIVKKIFSILDEPFYLEQRGVKMTASAGISIYPADGEDTQSLLINADSAMLQAKQFGGNRLEFYRKEINAQVPKQLELESDLHEAIKKNQLQLYYQPLVDLKSGQISGMEALMRWSHPTQGFISPAHFIPLAEETGLIIPLGEWALREACKQTRIWHEMGFNSLKVAVNLSTRQMREINLIETFTNVIKETSFDPNFLELEITETAILAETIIPLIKEFKNMGLSLAVDDFGTGYSGLSYLKRFSIDKLKIDQSFIRDIPSNNDSITIVSAIIAMAKELKVRTLAEGVETKEQLQFLISKGCDYVQGYYFSKPLDTSHFTNLLLSRRSLSQEIVLK